MTNNKALTIGLAGIGVLATAYIIYSFLPKGKKTPKKINPMNMKVAFMGDSYTSTPTHGWQSVLAKNYGFQEINLAKGGMRTDWMLSQTEKYLQNNKPDLYFIMGGANDAYSSVTINKALSNIQKMIDLCYAKGVKVIIVPGYNARTVQVGNTKQKPTSQQLAMGITQEKLWGMGEKYYQIQLGMLKLKNAIIVPIWEEANKNDTYDGLHMTWAANKRLADYIGQTLFTKQ